MPTRSGRTSIFFGKTDSVIGIEYRERKANQRFGITPTLLARYTTGTALGVKVRSKFGPDDLFVVAAAVTNGSNTTEQFHFYSEIDTNAGKTASGRLSLHPPLPVDLECRARTGRRTSLATAAASCGSRASTSPPTSRTSTSKRRC
jgi:hypothetical protein